MILNAFLITSFVRDPYYMVFVVRGRWGGKHHNKTKERSFSCTGYVFSRKRN